MWAEKTLCRPSHGVGVNAAVNMERTAGHLVIGYDRNFVTIAPRSVPIGAGAGDGEDAMAALSCSELEVKGIYLTKFVESLATGEAGIVFAKSFAQSEFKSTTLSNGSIWHNGPTGIFTNPYRQYVRRVDRRSLAAFDKTPPGIGKGVWINIIFQSVT